MEDWQNPCFAVQKMHLASAPLRAAAHNALQSKPLAHQRSLALQFTALIRADCEPMGVLISLLRRDRSPLLTG